MSCPRELEIDRLIGGSLEGADASALEAHIAGCPACAAERDRARRETEAYRRRLAPLRISGGLEEEIMASLPDPLPAPMSAAPRFGVVRWAVAAAIFVAVLAALVVPGRSTVSPTPAKAPRDPVRILSMDLTRAGETQKLLPEEIPFVGATLEAAGFWREVDLEGKAGGGTKLGDRKKIEICFTMTGTEGPRVMFVTLAEPGCIEVQRAEGGQTERMIDVAVFDRLWSILERAMNPLQLYVAKTTIQAGDPLPMKAVYRGGLDPSWDKAKQRPMLNFMFPDRTPDSTFLDENGRPVKVGRIGSSLDPMDVKPGASFSMDLDPEKSFGNLKRPGRYRISFGWGRQLSAEVEIIVEGELPKPAPTPSLRIVSMELGREDQSKQVLRSEEFPYVTADLEAAGLWTLEPAADEVQRERIHFKEFPKRRLEGRLARIREGSQAELRFALWDFESKDSGYLKLALGGNDWVYRYLDRAAFDRLWKSFDRTLNPMQLYLQPGSGRSRTFLAVYRGGLGKVPGFQLKVSEQRDGDCIGHEVSCSPGEEYRDTFAIPIEATLPVSTVPGTTPSKLFRARWEQGKSVSTDVVFDGGLAGVAEWDFLPTKAGMKLVYVNDDKEEEVVTVKGIRDVSDVNYVAIKFKNRIDYYRITEEGIFLCGVDLETSSSGDYRKNPNLQFKFGTVKGDTWKYSDSNGEALYENQGEEAVEVPAGKYSAVKIVSTYTAKAMNISRVTTEWWARGVGVVKRTRTMGPTTTVKVLKKID